MPSLDRLQILSNKYKLPQDFFLAVVELVEGRGYLVLDHLLKQLEQSKQAVLSNSRDLHEILRAQGAIQTTASLKAEISQIYNDVKKENE